MHNNYVIVAKVKNHTHTMQKLLKLKDIHNNMMGFPNPLSASLIHT